MATSHYASSESQAPLDDWEGERSSRRDGNAQEGLSIDFPAIRGMIWRQRFTLIFIIGAALILGFVATLVTTPIYRATATVKVDPKPATVIDGQDSLQISGRDLRAYKLTLASVLQSRSVAGRVADELKLDRKLGADASARPAGMTQEAWRAHNRNIAIATLQGGLSVDVPAEANIISISFNSADPVLAAEAANAYSDNFVTDDIRRSLEQSAYARKYLLDQINQLQRKLSESERQSISYARAARIVSPGLLSQPTTGNSSTDSSAPATVTGSNLSSINSAYTLARATRIAAEQRWKTASVTRAANLPEVQQNPMVQNLLSERGKVAVNLADLRTRYGEDYPQARELKAQLATLDKQIQQVSEEVKGSIRSVYETAMRQEGALAEEVGKVSDESLDEQSRRVQFGQLERETAAYRAQLDAMLARYNELSATANIKPSTVTKLDDAERPTSPVSPVLAKNLLVAVVLGFGLAIGVAILREIFDDRLRSVAEVERKLGIATLGVTPLVPEGGKEDGSFALEEAYSSICTAIEFALPAREHNVVSFTSTQGAEGKSTTSLIVAKKFARHGRKVLLIDGDLRKPSIAVQAGFPRPKVGLTELLLGTVSLEGALLPNIQPDLDILPTGTVPTQPVEVLSSPLFAEFLEKCREDYWLVIIDSPPVMGLADAPIISSVADCTVFVVEANRAHFGAAKAALRRLRDADANVLGAILTKFQSLIAGQSYDYQYSYYSYGSDK